MALPDLGVESLLGPDGDGQLSQELRDRLALATRYIANWYRATKGSSNQEIWWQRIDALRAKVEAAYSALIQPENRTFPGHGELALYADAAAAWPQLWRDLTLSIDTVPRPELLTQAADLLDTLASTPALLAARIGNELGKAVGGAAGNFVARSWGALALAGGIALLYIFREPLSRLAGKVGT